MIRVTVWNEFKHEKEEEQIRRIYPRIFRKRRGYYGKNRYIG